MNCKLSITTALKAGKSYLKDLFVSAPFRVVPVGQTKSDQSAYLMIMSSSPGILDGDHYDLNIKVEKGARLQLQSQSYQRLFNMDGQASQLLNITLEENTAFSYVPHPVVPHADSTFKSIARINICDGSELLMGEIITCGRKHHGEIFRFKHFQNLIEVRHNNKIVLKDNVLLRPQLVPLESIGQLEGYTHQGTLVYINTQNRPVNEMIESFYEMLLSERDMEFGISKIQCDGFVLRCLAQGGEQIFDCFQRIQNIIWNKIVHV